MSEQVASDTCASGKRDEVRSAAPFDRATRGSDGTLALGHLKLGTYLIGCGGTGGHLAPGIALAQELVARGHAVALLISEKQVDARLAAKYPELRFLRMPAAPFALRPAALARCVVQQLRGLQFALRAVRTHRPAAVIGFGGFTTAALVLAAVACGVPAALHEANRVPGRAIRSMARFARRVYLPVGIPLAGVRPERIRYAGLPLRREMRREPREAAAAAFGLDPALKIVVVLGGSQGATALNDWARREAPVLAAAGVQLCGVTGARQGEGETLRFAGPGEAAVTARFLPFCDRMATLLSAADLVVSRAGAGTLAELIRCRAPAILVPYPAAADNHQAANAAFFERQGGGLVVEQSDLGRLTSEVLDALAGGDLLPAFRRNLRRLDQVDTAALMADDLIGLKDGADAAPGLQPRPAAA